MRPNRWGLFDGAKIARALPKTARVDPREFARREVERGAHILALGRGNTVLMTLRGESKSIGWTDKTAIEEAFGIRYDAAEGTSFSSADERSGERYELIYLGREEGLGSRSYFALDLARHELLSSPKSGFGEIRSFLKSRDDLLGSEEGASVSRAGYALALRNWGKGIRFCPSCGSATRSTQIGTRKECTDCGKKQYPRLDPVAICLVVSQDGSHALLGSPRYASGRMLTCLAGFIEQCETIEEAVVREIEEESGVQVDQVQLLGSQPWPLGRSGACELMIGCVARAKSNPETRDLIVDQEELNSASWVPKEVVAQKLAKSKARRRKSGKPGELETWIVPPYAIAHHLIDHWINGDNEDVSRLSKVVARSEASRL
ncbi:NUDIX hydrolase [Chloropicon primus]|uniref:NAD(+) diphosphatase n=1 Tax=Chloropicon primus TaxID=1764295 RepID=A0A5B8MFZ1_9CHLO|nr:NUDIX hydrolase [Chloropicon primus]UPQ98800.1 NUDIX hydrolase [Chloropicon primus]|eukprot:QDZ19588.1 NUDIX hydrolase [Chloropicon primus]